MSAYSIAGVASGENPWLRTPEQHGEASSSAVSLPQEDSPETFNVRAFVWPMGTSFQASAF